MIDVAILSVIRRWHFREGISIREIARRTKLSRNTISKYLASNVVEPRYVRRKSPSQLDAFAAELTRWLTSNARLGRKQRRTARQMYNALVSLGYAGSYSRVAAFARRWRQQQQELARTAGRGAFVPLTFAPGEAFQFDWSEDFAVLDGERTKLQIAQFKLSHSRAFRRSNGTNAVHLKTKPGSSIAQRCELKSRNVRSWLGQNKPRQGSAEPQGGAFLVARRSSGQTMLDAGGQSLMDRALTQNRWQRSNPGRLRAAFRTLQYRL